MPPMVSRSHRHFSFLSLPYSWDQRDQEKESCFYKHTLVPLWELCACDMPLCWLRLPVTLKWATPTMASPQQQPRAALADLRLCLLLWSLSISRLVFLFSRCLLFAPEPLSFPKNPAFSWCAWSRTASVLSFLPPTTFKYLLRDTLVHPSAGPGYPRSSLSCCTIFQVNQLFPPSSLLHCLTFGSSDSNWEYEVRILAFYNLGSSFPRQSYAEGSNCHH